MKIALAAMVACVAASAHDIGSQVTWSREISRLLVRHCAACHRDGGTAFPLTTFPQAQARAKAIGRAVLERRMPPFGAVKGFGELRDDHSLTQEQIELVTNWVQAGAPEGTASLAPKDLTPQPAALESPARVVEWTGTKLGAGSTFIGVRAKTMPGDTARVVAELPDGSVQPLIWFYRYDPKFARTYYFRSPLKLPAGTRIVSSVPGVTVALLQPGH